jgi:hypothetical protein
MASSLVNRDRGSQPSTTPKRQINRGALPTQLPREEIVIDVEDPESVGTRRARCKPLPSQRLLGQSSGRGGGKWNRPTSRGNCRVLAQHRPATGRCMCSLGRSRHQGHRSLLDPALIPDHARHRFRYECRAGLHHCRANETSSRQRRDILQSPPIPGHGARQPLHDRRGSHAGELGGKSLKRRPVSCLNTGQK